ncbi:centrosomal protein of 152 kDa isoform X1 [Gambusia affinis]|uniref:centrosomal protein of 152 kDa isoform X1 n=1 Tax=Gambusia affinis TaxID=33528 RepID=UPI001CDC24BC|nr:centrosomal protein of 152 kDa isoform X1 [Gambusia affinis]XP_043980959.1 centrosomal protein of 152 kDa isoform X1 [Gambusia affinis]
MSIDFDSPALQTQHEEDEYDQEDYAREQELHKLLTDLPDDMLEDSRDSSSPELESSTYSNKNTGSSPQTKWNQDWSDHSHPTSHTQTYEVDYDHGSHDEYAYEDGPAHTNGHLTQNLPPGWNQGRHFAQENRTNMDLDGYPETGDYSAECDPRLFPESTRSNLDYNGDGGYRSPQCHGDHNTRNHFQKLTSGLGDHGNNELKVNYNPQHPAHQPKMLNPHSAQQKDQFEQLQRDFLDSTQQTADREQVAQLQVLNKAQQRQIEDLERKLEDSRRNMRYVEHQFAIVKDEKEGLAVSFRESSRLIEEAKKGEAQMQNKLKALEQQVKILKEKDQENMKKLKVADAAVDSMKQQMLELCRSDTLSRARQQHDRDLAVIKEQHEAALLALQQKLDSTSQALNDQIDVSQKLQQQVQQLEHQREEEHLERARIVNSLSQRLEESQQQCAKLLQTNSVQEMSQMQVKLQQAQSAKTLSENINKVLQEDMAELKEQITLYESALKHGVIAFEFSNDWENQLSESCLDLGLKKPERKNGTVHSATMNHLSDSKLPKEEALRLLRVEMQRCLGCLKGKRQKINQLQEELRLAQGRVGELEAQLEEAKLCSAARETSQMKHLDTTEGSQKETHLLEQVEMLEKMNKELKQNEEKLKSANSELCTKMREMIQELDQEKQEATQRTERINQQYRDDVVNRVRTELLLEHNAEVEQLTAQHQQEIQQLQNQLSEVSDKVLAVQECYISVCREKCFLEETLQKKQEEESSKALEKLRGELEAQHQAGMLKLKEDWTREKEAEIQQEVSSHVEAKWKKELQKRETTWVQKLEEAKKQRNAAEVSCQTDELDASGRAISAEELDSRLAAQKQQLQLEADKVQRKAVVEARKQIQRELEEKHLNDMAKQVEGAVTRAYSRWIEDLSSLPEYQTLLQREKEKWEELQEETTKEKVSQALQEAEEEWRKNPVEQQKAVDLQEELAALKSQLEQASREQAALLKAELAAARAAWFRDKQQEISIIQARNEQTYQTKLQEQCKNLEQAVQEAREDAELQRKELLLQLEANLQQTLRTREEEWRCQYEEKELAERQQKKEKFVSELQVALAQVSSRLLRPAETEHQEAEDSKRTSGSPSETTVTNIIETSCRDMMNRAVTEAKKEWKKMSEEKLSCILKETQEKHTREINEIQGSFAQRKAESGCRKGCTESLGKLQKKNQELQRHLEKTCRQLQHRIREHKTAIQRLRDEHESSIQKLKEEHLQQLEEVKRANESSGSSDNRQNLQQGLEEMKQQYLVTVEKIRGDVLRYLQESRERAADMIRSEVQRERQDTARKMRRYYLTCLQELLEDGGKAAGAEKKIMSAASKLAAMAKVLETPVKSNSGKNYSLPTGCLTGESSGAVVGVPTRSSGFRSNLTTLNELLDVRPEQQPQREKVSADLGLKSTAAFRTKPLSHQDSEDGPVMKPQTPDTNSFPHKPSQSHVGYAGLSARGKSAEWFLQRGDSSKAELARQSRPLLIQEAPVREEKQTDWSLTSNDSDSGPNAAGPRRKPKPLRPFSANSASDADMGARGISTPDDSDLTVYKEIPKQSPQTENNRKAKKSLAREPIPGSDGDVFSRPPFSELRQRQQDSGFDSPFYLQK